jgi:hypothetical protein
VVLGLQITNMVSIDSEYSNRPAHQGSQLFAQLDGESEISVREFCYALAFFDMDIKKRVPLLFQFMKAAKSWLRKRFMLSA